MKEARNKTFIWISWLAKLLAGEIQCEYQCWFQAHYKYDKLPSDFNLINWTMQHNRLVHKTRDELETQGYKVYIEDQNSLKMETDLVIISAKPDIKAFKEDENLTIDCKTGRPKNSDQIQVMLYMLYIPKTQAIILPDDPPWEGRIVYKKNSVPIPSVMMTKSFENMIDEAIVKLTASTARKVPSVNECRRCNISSENCPERMEDDGRQY